MGLVMTPACTASPSCNLSAQGSEQPLGAWHRLLGDLRGKSLCFTGPDPIPKELRSDVLHALALLNLSVCLLIPRSLSLAAVSPRPASCLLSWNLWGVQPRPVIPCRLGLKLTASASASLFLFSPTGSFHLPRLCPLMLPLTVAQVHCVSPFHLSWSLLWPPPFSASVSVLFLCLGLLSLCLLGDIAEVLEFGALPVLGSLRTPGRVEAWTQPPTPPLERHPDGPSAAVLRASLWSSCVVLPLLALTWMSAVLAMTDRRSVLFQALFAVFNSAQGFVITAVHCFLRREVGLGVSCPLPSTSPVQTGRIQAPTGPPAGQPLVLEAGSLGQPCPWTPGLPGLLLPSDLPLHWMRLFLSIPAWAPGVGGTASCGRGPCGGLRPSRHPLPPGPGRGEVPDGCVPGR